MLSDHCGCGSSLLLALPEDVLAMVTQPLSPRDVCNLGLCCRSLHAFLAFSDKIWLNQCAMIGVIPPNDLVEWRKGIASYKALCRFLFNVVKPLIGIWVHQNPELGNVVNVMPGFISVVECRIIPQELGPLGLDEGPILWALRETDYFYPSSLKPVDRTCNVLLLEVEPRQRRNGGNLISLPNSGISKSQRVLEQKVPAIPFGKLAFGDRRKLLEIVTGQVALKVPDCANRIFFPLLSREDRNFQQDIKLLYERRSLLIRMFKFGGSYIDWKDDRDSSPKDAIRLELSEIRKTLERSSHSNNFLNGDDGRPHCTKKKTLGGYFQDSLKQILGKSGSTNGDTVGLTLRASTMILSSYRAWPNMHDSRFALYKLPVRIPKLGQEYSGLWGGTFGWPPGRLTEDKPGKALFFVLLSYEESQEGTHYVLHPNGSAMFIVNIHEPSLEPFPWTTDGDSRPVEVKHAFLGEGIANGYGFRYPGSKPGSLFVIQGGFLAFIWKVSRVVLTLQKHNLAELLKKGERVPALPPIANFSYLMKSYSNVFAGFSNTSNCLSSPR
ncbi:hypothetical protein NMG60_11029780 [Bertholletia excelsa]